MNTVLIIVGASIYILAFVLVIERQAISSGAIKWTRWDMVKPVIWLFIAIMMIVGPFVCFIGGGYL